MEMKVAAGFIMAVCLLYAAVATPLPDPGRQLLRVPRIYNALINSDAKLQPSRAYPYSSPVFQPGFEIQEQWQPQGYGLEPEEPVPSQETSTAAPPKENDENDKTKMQKEKATSALTFYPRSFGFYQPQPIIPYAYSFAPQPFLFGSPYVFGETFYRYPTPSFDGYHASHLGLYAPGVDQFGIGYKPDSGQGGNEYKPDIDQVGSGHKPDNDQGGSDHKLENKDGHKIVMKTDERHDTEGIALKSDLVGIRESDFLSNDESPETSPDSSDVKKINDKRETS